MTTRGFNEADSITLAGWMCDIIESGGETAVIEKIKAQVLDICQRLPVYE
jgi:glycine hydroxymethyltransferase